MEESEQSCSVGGRTFSKEPIGVLAEENQSFYQERRVLLRENKMLGKQIFSLLQVKTELQNNIQTIQQKEKQTTKLERMHSNKKTTCENSTLDSLSVNIKKLFEKLSKLEMSTCWNQICHTARSKAMETEILVKQLEKEKEFLTEELQEACENINHLTKELDYYKEQVSKQIQSADILKQHKKTETSLKEKTAENVVLKEKICRLEERNSAINEFFTKEMADILQKEQLYKSKIKQLEKQQPVMSKKDNSNCTECPNDVPKCHDDLISDSNSVFYLERQPSETGSINGNNAVKKCRKTVSWSEDVKDNLRESSKLYREEKCASLLGKSNFNSTYYGNHKYRGRRKHRKF